MVAQCVKTPKPAEIRATVLLFPTLCSHWTVVMPAENTLRQASGHQAPDASVPDYKT